MTENTVTVIEPEELAAALEEQAAFMLIQVTSAEVFYQAHISGAKLVEPRQLVDGTPPATGRLPDVERLSELFSSIGYAADQNIIVYDDEGGGWAGRLGWTLDVIGHRSWTYLNGGLHAWVNAGYPLAQGAPEAPNDQLSAPAITIDQAPIAEVDDVLKAIDATDEVIWDVRSAEEFLGLRSGSQRAGHIPGAVNLDWLQLKDAGRDQRLSLDIPVRLEELGLTRAGRVITHCQTHHRSGLSYMVGRIHGLNIAAYHGSWSEWGNLADTPVENPSEART